MIKKNYVTPLMRVETVTMVECMLQASGCDIPVNGVVSDAPDLIKEFNFEVDELQNCQDLKLW